MNSYTLNQNTRRSGKTTRMIDECVQLLFSGETLFFPSKLRMQQDLEESPESRARVSVWNKESFKRKMKQTPIIEHDWEYARANEYLIKRLINRLEFEHGIKYTGKPNPNGLILSIADFKPKN